MIYTYSENIDAIFSRDICQFFGTTNWFWAWFRGGVQIEKAQDAINNYIMDIQANQKNWISKDKIYNPISMGGLNCIKLEQFFHSIRLNWMHRYISLGYKDFWTSILDKFLDINPQTRKNILKGALSERDKLPLYNPIF